MTSFTNILDKVENIESLSINKTLFKKALSNVKDYVLKEHFYILDFYNIYNTHYKSLANKTFLPQDLETKEGLFIFRGYTKKGYLIYSHDDNEFWVNEDFFDTFFYIIVDEKPSVRFKILNTNSIMDIDISFFHFDDGCVLFETVESKNKKIEELIFYTTNNNIGFAKYIEQLEFINGSIKSYTTNNDYEVEFKNRYPLIKKFSFVRKQANDINLCQILCIENDSYVKQVGEKLFILRKSGSKKSNLMILNPFLVDSFQFDLFELKNAK